ncbi:hypothetical protein GCM10011348_08790 [Marinobacterium nitratireducens]|uniref:CYTH domain-containing protein n=1 Tax=Marinobacterium nitratireducens TaxID=518897 RepID=A0A917ZB34_9GAMM|nr:CYTH domain-containing protein [Marinobacterium nitratireducens]GGO77986.1 hypothetical protein GCM10011348_08790 [Marinobacterium nitratireducens]
MAREIELKLSLDEDDVAKLRALPLLAAGAEYRGSVPLHNRYFDTPGQALASHRVALRIREDGGRYIQTLKTRGASQGGLHQRNEWEWELPAPELDYRLLAEASWPQALSDASVQREIVPAFRTDFERSTWWLRRPGCAGDEALIELVLDLGEVTAGAAGRDALCEIELELKAGQAEDLYAVAQELAAEVPLLVSDISKAERGYRLLRDGRCDAAPRPLRLGISARDAFIGSAEQALNRVSRGFEQWQHGRNWQDALAASQGLTQLRATLDCFSSLLPETVPASLLPGLAQLSWELDGALAWQRLLPLMDVDLAARWQASQSPDGAARLQRLLRTTLVGRLLLDCSRLLIIEDWPPEASQSVAAFRIMEQS